MKWTSTLRDKQSHKRDKKSLCNNRVFLRWAKSMGFAQSLCRFISSLKRCFSFTIERVAIPLLMTTSKGVLLYIKNSFSQCVEKSLMNMRQYLWTFMGTNFHKFVAEEWRLPSIWSHDHLWICWSDPSTSTIITYFSKFRDFWLQYWLPSNQVPKLSLMH